MLPDEANIWMTRKQVADLAECSMATVRRAEKDLRTKLSSPLNQVMIHRDDAESWAELYTEQRSKRSVLRREANKPTSLSMIRMFRDGSAPVDVALELQIPLTDAMAAWNEYQSSMHAHETKSLWPAPKPKRAKKEKSDRWWDVYCAVLPALIKDQPVHSTSDKRAIHKQAVGFADIAAAMETQKEGPPR